MMIRDSGLLFWDTL